MKNLFVTLAFLCLLCGGAGAFAESGKSRIWLESSTEAGFPAFFEKMKADGQTDQDGNILLSGLLVAVKAYAVEDGDLLPTSSEAEVSSYFWQFLEVNGFNRSLQIPTYFTPTQFKAIGQGPGWWMPVTATIATPANQPQVVVAEPPAGEAILPVTGSLEFMLERLRDRVGKGEADMAEARGLLMNLNSRIRGLDAESKRMNALIVDQGQRLTSLESAQIATTERVSQIEGSVKTLADEGLATRERLTSLESAQIATTERVSQWEASSQEFADQLAALQKPLGYEVLSGLLPATAMKLYEENRYAVYFSIFILGGLMYVAYLALYRRRRLKVPGKTPATTPVKDDINDDVVVGMKSTKHDRLRKEMAEEWLAPLRNAS